MSSASSPTVLRLPRLACVLCAWLALAAGCATTKTASAPALPAVRVLHAPAKIRHDTFPRGRPPPHPTLFSGRELGLCDTGFACFVEIGVEYPRLSYKTMEATVTSVALTTQLDIIIWCEEGSKPEVLAHEETHRAISEHYYRDAEEIARRLGQGLIGRKVMLSTRDLKGSLEEALDPLQRELLRAYQHETHERCEFAQRRFDEITDHGNEPITNEAAMKQALADEAQDWARTGFTPPASPSPFAL